MYVQNFRSVAQKLCPLRAGQTYIHRTNRQKGETGETWGKPKYVTRLRTGQYTVQICETVQFSD